MCIIIGLAITAPVVHAQTPAAPDTTSEAASPGTSNDLFVMFGSDFDRPGNIGLGHTVGFLKKDPFGDELTFGYTYENSGTHGFLHTMFGDTPNLPAW